MVIGFPMQIDHFYERERSSMDDNRPPVKYVKIAHVAFIGETDLGTWVIEDTEFKSKVICDL